MISEGRSGLDNVFTLKDGARTIFFPSTLANDHLGILRLELGKEVFERTGLTGKPIRSGARKHAKERYSMTPHVHL